MRRAWNRVIVASLNGGLRVFRLPGLRSPRIYTLWGVAGLQPLAERLSRRRAFDVYVRAARDCPAYAWFLREQNAPPIRGPGAFGRLPETTKENYIHRWSIEERCHHGAIPRCGVMIDESSGSSGTPNNWVRGPEDRASVARLIRHAFRMRFERQRMIFLNCFALGPWATGMNTSMAMVDAAILKSIGPDAGKLESTIRLFGSKYEYVVAGYPPFIKDWLDRTALDLSAHRLHLVCGGEGYSLGLRRRFEQVFRTVVSSYGASDLEINIAAETALSIALRERCHADPALCRALFGRDDPPMIFQYNPIDYLIEQSDEGELVITVLRRSAVAPKVRYNIRDLGGSLPHREAARRLMEHDGASIGSLAPGAPALPFLYVYGRNDLSVPFYGAKVFTTDLERIINESQELSGAIGSFCMEMRESGDLAKTLLIHLERRAGRPGAQCDAAAPETMYTRLCEVNQDFREVSRLFGPEQIEVRLHDHETGPFQGADRRIKRQYVR